MKDSNWNLEQMQTLAKSAQADAWCILMANLSKYNIGYPMFNSLKKVYYKKHIEIKECDQEMEFFLLSNLTKIV